MMEDVKCLTSVHVENVESRDFGSKFEVVNVKWVSDGKGRGIDMLNWPSIYL